MSVSRLQRYFPVFFLAILLAGCGGGGANSCVPERSADYFVNSAKGVDTNTGNSCQPFKTISKALAVATTGQRIQVAPGTYGDANGEVFPLMIPDGVILIGDETNKGAGGKPTRVIGGGQATFYAAGFIGATIEPGTGSTIAGFTITNNDSSGISFPMALVIRTGSTVTVRNNTLTDSISHVLYVTGGTTNHVIAGNHIVNNVSGLGIGFIGGGVGSKVENNVITGNLYGVEYDTPGGDLGGGAASSAGGNVISCNTFNDIWTNLNSSNTISASNNFWDHNPPSTGCSSGNDICNSNSAVITTTGSALAAIPCP